jgi:hypothetical protein
MEREKNQSGSDSKGVMMTKKKNNGLTTEKYSHVAS